MAVYEDSIECIHSDALFQPGTPVIPGRYGPGLFPHSARQD
jgi:hypothetical protein